MRNMIFGAALDVFRRPALLNPPCLRASETPSGPVVGGGRLRTRSPQMRKAEVSRAPRGHRDLPDDEAGPLPWRTRMLTFRKVPISNPLVLFRG